MVELLPDEVEGCDGELLAEEVIEGPLEISFRAMVGVVGVNSIHSVERINSKETSFLVDSGATRNFVDPLTARRLGLKILKVGAFEVMVADGEKITGGECCRDTKLVIQGYESVIDLMVMPWGDPQVILGTVWLKGLGSSLWDFGNRTLSFWVEGKEIILHGIQPRPLEIVEGETMNRLLQL